MQLRRNDIVYINIYICTYQDGPRRTRPRVEEYVPLSKYQMGVGMSFKFVIQKPGKHRRQYIFI